MKIASLNLLAFVGLFSACTLANPDGFLSINCGASNNDTNGEFEWITDSLFIKFRNTFIRPPFTFSNIAYQYQSVAYFTNMEAKKYCYLLPVRPHIQYLVRVRFVLKGFENLRLASVFDLYIEGIKWAKVDLANFPNSLYAYCEIILTPKRDSMSLCLARNSETQESYYVFISTIELRPLQSQMYSTYTDFNYSALSLFSRINFGSFDEIKFPQDQYDRMWQTFQVPLTTNISTNDSSFRSVKNQQPESVLKTAITSQVGEELLISNWFNVVPGIYYFALYLCNINKTSLSGNNTFQVFIGNVQIAETEVPEYMYCLSPERRLQLSTTDSIDIRIGPQEGSEMRPFINAAEAYQILNITNMTQAGDVLAIRQIAETANVPDDWTTGDPCLPADLPLTGVMCNEEDPPRVTTVNLTNRGLTGNIPPSIANLTGLKRLLLGNNNFSGAIPDLSTLKNLTTLQLQNNQLTGNIPSSLEKLPVLNELILQNNKLDGDVPPGLVKPGLNLQINPQRKSTQEKKSKENGLIIGLAIGCFVLLVVVIFGIRLWRQKYNQGNLTSSSTMQPQHSLTDNEFQKLVVEYSEEDIKAATNNYSTIIGKGGFGSVFYGKLSGNDVAVKILSTNSSQGKQEFRNEVTLLSRVHHKNLVNLIGYCRQPIVALVYEFMECGTLMDHLHGSAKQEKPLDWQTRINIALQAAQGLLYLHEGCSPPIIHRDVKCSNILLDKRMFAKITDFGLSKLLDNAKSYITTNVKGTLGYLDPEYFGKSSLNEKSDVYSFGVVLLEIISGVPPKEGLVELAKELLNCGRLADLVDSSLGGRYSVESARKVTNIAYACVEAKSINRPTMNIVVKELAEAKELLFDDSGESANVASSNVLDEMPEAR